MPHDRAGTATLSGRLHVCTLLGLDLTAGRFHAATTLLILVSSATNLLPCAVTGHNRLLLRNHPTNPYDWELFEVSDVPLALVDYPRRFRPPATHTTIFANESVYKHLRTAPFGDDHPNILYGMVVAAN